MKNRSLLLTGATGRLGSVLAARSGPDWDPVPLSRCGDGGTGKFDILYDSAGEFLRELEIGAAVNAAAVSSPAECSRKPLECLVVNSLWPCILAALCRDLSVPMVHFSSDLVYSGGNPPYSENSPAVPVSLYGWSKLLADVLVRKVYPRALIVRTSVLCGDTPSKKATFSQDLLSGRLKRVYVDSWRNHTPIGWLADLTFSLIGSGTCGLVIASGRYSQSRAAYAEQLLQSRGMSIEGLVQAYAPPGTPRELSLCGRYWTESIFDQSDAAR